MRIERVGVDRQPLAAAEALVQPVCQQQKVVGVVQVDVQAKLHRDPGVQQMPDVVRDDAIGASAVAIDKGLAAVIDRLGAVERDLNAPEAPLRDGFLHERVVKEIGVGDHG